MLSETQIQALIVLRVQACAGSCNSYYMRRCDGQIEALLCVLHNGQHHRVGDGVMTTDIFDLAGIKYTVEGDMTKIDDSELGRIGLISDNEGYMKAKDPLLGVW